MFDAKRSDAKFCGPACRMAVSRMTRSIKRAEADRDKDRKAHLYRYTMQTLDKKKLAVLIKQRDSGRHLEPEVLAAISDRERDWGVS